MKKIIKYLVLPFIILLSSCGPMISKFEVETQEGINEPIKISREDYDLMINEEKSFILYIALTTCGSCKKFSENALNPFIKESNVIIYRIEAYHIDDAINYIATPAISIIKEGEVINTVNMLDDGKYFTSKKSFKKFIDRYITY